MKIILALNPKEIIVKFGLLSDKTIEIVDSEDWVSNIGNVNCCYPSDLRGDTKIEVKRRDGTKLSGVASIWRLHGKKLWVVEPTLWHIEFCNHDK